MIPLVTSRLVLTFLCGHPSESASKWQKIAYSAFYIIGVVSLYVYLETSVRYFVKFMVINLEEALYTVFQIAANATILYFCIIAFFSKYKMAGMFQKLSKIYETGNNSIDLCE